MSEPLILRNTEDGSWSFWCPGCKCAHCFYVDKPSPYFCRTCGAAWSAGWQAKEEFHFPGCTARDIAGHEQWTFNGNFERPTFQPSLVCGSYRPGHRCHLFLTDGRIQFLSDCEHELRGQTVPLQPF